MAIQNQPLSDLNQSTVFENLQLIIQQVQEFYVSAEVKRGPFHDLILYFSSILATANQENVTRVREANSLQAIIDDPTLADPLIVDNVLANWLVTRKAGVAATGTISIILDTALSLTIPQGFQFVANGVSFLSTVAFTSRVSASQVTSSTDRLLTALPNGQYQFTIDALASINGPDGLIPRGTLFTLATNLSASFVKAFSGTDFVGGVAEETNTELIARFQTSAGLKAWSNRITSEALILAQPDFENIVAMSIIGYGDPEMKRDASSIFPGSFGGRSSLLARTQPKVALTLVSPVTATLISKVGPVGIWQSAITKEMSPAFYDVVKITRLNYVDIDDTFVIDSDVRGVDLSGSGYIPDINQTIQGVYSAYETSVISFTDDLTNASSLSIGATNEYDFLFRGMPLIKELQDFLGQRDVISPSSDILVLAPVPVYVSIDIEIDYQSGQDVPAEADIQNAATDAVNSVGFTGRLVASDISNAVAAILPVYAAVNSITLNGTIRQIDGTLVSISSSTTLLIPTDPDNFVSGRVCQFYQQQEDVNVTLTPVSVLVV